MKLITLILTCKDEEEANKISEALLKDKLIACARRTPVKSDFYWQGKSESSDEMMLIMESVEEKFDEIEKQVHALHSYDMFVLTAYPILKSSKGVEEWVNEATR